MTTAKDSSPDDVELNLIGAVSSPLYLTVLLGAVTSVRLSSGIAVETARGLASAGSRLARRGRPPRV